LSSTSKRRQLITGFPVSAATRADLADAPGKPISTPAAHTAPNDTAYLTGFNGMEPP
jgi:hypothetical protein